MPEGGGGAATIAGLSSEEVLDRVARGQTNDVPPAPTRTLWEIVRANVFTPFNALLGVLFVIILIVGPLQDALFGGVLIANAAIGIVQEWRAKRTLERLTVLTAPRARVIRDGEVREIPVNEIVLDDVLDLRSGDQIVVDGDVVSSSGLEVDESLLTGEADPVVKEPGEPVLSGSFVAAGGGRYRATKVGADAYAVTLAEEARAFTLVDSELRRGIDSIVKIVAWAMLPTAALLLASQLRADVGVAEAARGTVAGVVAMVPEGLVLLTSVAFAVAVVRLGRRQVLVQELPAVEVLARVDVMCIDKTGTLTEGKLAVDAVEPLDGAARAPVEVEEALASLARAEPNPNATMLAIRDAVPEPTIPWWREDSVPFSSARKWSAGRFRDHGTWVVGAPEVLLDEERDAALAGRIEAHAESGRRVLLVQRSDVPLDGERLPGGRAPRALVVLRDRPRDDAPETMGYFREQGVAIKVISGDNARTVSAIAGQIGLEGSERWFDARQLPEDAEAIADALDRHTVFGRVTPRQKRTMVGALQGRGHVVAMTGDGVNDVLALKDADIGVAMGSGSDASRAVAELVLMNSSFSSMPSVVAEGRRVLANIERTAKLFVTKTVYAMLLALAVGFFGFPFPFLPRHLTLIGSLTIGIPAFVLTFERTSQRARAGFTKRVLRFAVPAGVMAAIATFVAYAFVLEVVDAGVAQARTAATLSLFLIGMAVVVIVARPLTRTDLALIGGMCALFALAVMIPAVRTFFELRFPSLEVLLAAVAIAAVVAVAVQLAIPGRLDADDGSAESG